MSIFDDIFSDDDFLLGEEEENESQNQENSEIWTTGQPQDMWTTDEIWTLGEEDYNEPDDEFDMSDLF